MGRHESGSWLIGMGIVRGLFLAVAGAATFVTACVIPWQVSVNLVVSPPPLRGASITPTGEAGPHAPAASSRAGGTPDADQPAPPPELATLAPRTALAPPPSEAPLPADRFVLAQHLQRELTRVGCYEGEPHGIWTPAARRAMKTFTDRINAALPTDEPDYILLALVQAARDKVCGATCPEGEGLAEGRCVPDAILAGKKAPQPTRVAPAQAGPGWSVTRMPTATPSSSDEAGRMGLAGPSGPGMADAGQPAAALNAPAVPAAARPANAKRAQSQPVGFGTVIFRQFGKLGF